MTNKKNWLGILLMALVFAMTVVGCKDSDEGSTILDGKWRDGPSSNYTQIELKGNN